MDESKIHGLHRIGEVLEALYPELITQINHKRMEYFKVIVHNSTSTMEVNRETFGDFILKRLCEKKPDEVKQPF